MSSVTFPAVAGGATYTDDSNATTGLANGGHKTRFIPALKAVVDTAADVVVKSSAASASAAEAAASAAYINGVAGGGTAAALAGSATQDFAAKTLTATTVNANNIGEITHSQGIVTTYAASGSTGIQIPNNNNLNFGTGDFTLVWKIRSLSQSTTVGTIAHKAAATGVYGFFIQLLSGSRVSLWLPNPAQSGWVQYTSNTLNYLDDTVHTIALAITRETAFVAGRIDVISDGVLIQSITIPAAALGSLTSTANLYVLGSNTARGAATTQYFYAFNRALSADEVLSLYKSPYGVAESDKWGSQVSILTGAWLNGYTTAFQMFSSTAPTGFTASDTGTKTGVRVQVLGPIQKGKSFKLSFVPTYTGVTNIKFYIAWGTYSGIQDITPQISSGVESSIEFTNTFTSDALSVMIICDISNGSMTLSNVALIQYGATLALESEGIQPAPGQWLDSSTNKLHAMQPATGSSLTRKKESFEVRWTNTWAGTHEAQFLGGINQAVLPPNCYIESIIGVVSGTVIEDIILGDGVDTDRWVTITTGLAAGTVTFAVASRVSDGTNRKLVVDPDANFTGSISWVIKGFTL